MEELIDNLSLLGWVNVVFWCFIYIGILVIFTLKKQRELWGMLIGEDGTLQIIEGMLALWFFTFPFFVVSVMAFNINPPEEMYIMLEIIGPASVFGILGKQGIKVYNKNKEENEP